MCWEHCFQYAGIYGVVALPVFLSSRHVFSVLFVLLLLVYDKRQLLYTSCPPLLMGPSANLAPMSPDVEIFLNV